MLVDLRVGMLGFVEVMFKRQMYENSLIKEVK